MGVGSNKRPMILFCITIHVDKNGIKNFTLCFYKKTYIVGTHWKNPTNDSKRVALNMFSWEDKKCISI